MPVNLLFPLQVLLFCNSLIHTERPQECRMLALRVRSSPSPTSLFLFPSFTYKDRGPWYRFRDIINAIHSLEIRRKCVFYKWILPLSCDYNKRNKHHLEPEINFANILYSPSCTILALYCATLRLEARFFSCLSAFVHSHHIKAFRHRSIDIYISIRTIFEHITVRTVALWVATTCT